MEKRIVREVRTDFGDDLSAGYYSDGRVLCIGETRHGTNMTQMGPESLLVMAATARHGDLAEYARLEYSLAEAPRVEMTLRRKFEAMPSKRDATRHFLGRALRLFRREDAGQPAMGSAVRAKVIESIAGSVAQAQSPPGTSLAALPAIEAGSRRGGGASPLSAMPTMGRA